MSEAGERPGEGWRAIVAHAAPFAAWLALMALPWPAPAARYALQAAVGLALLLALRPWRYYVGGRGARGLPAAVLLGAGVAALWILPESPWADAWPALRDLYARWAVRPLGALSEGAATSPYAPDQCGWTLAVVRLLGSAFVIAVAEEFFWRGFFLRWFQARAFLGVDPRRIGAAAFWIVVALFAVEHSRWLAGALAGAAYGWFYVRTGDLRATAAAHAVTNLLLGLYVLAFGAYRFW